MELIKKVDALKAAIESGDMKKATKLTREIEMDLMKTAVKPTKQRKPVTADNEESSFMKMANAIIDGRKSGRY